MAPAAKQDGISYRVIVGWLVPALLSGLLGVLCWIGSNIQSMSQTLAVAVQRIEDHDRRLSNLETLFLKP